MKRKIKQLFLACMLAAGLLTMAGCSQAEEEMEPLDPALEQALNQEAQQFLEQMAAMDDETIEENLEYFNQEQLTVYASGLNSWKSAKKDLGAYESVESAVSVPTDDGGYETTLTVNFEERECEFLMGRDRKGNLTEITVSPDYTMGEVMAQAAGNLIVGMGMVFAVLIFIMLIISAFRFIPQDLGKKKETAAPKPETPALAPADAALAAPQAEDEIAAVIAAAVAAYEAEQGSGAACGNGLVVRSIRRISKAKSRR